MTHDDLPTGRELREEMARNSRWLAELHARADANGMVSEQDARAVAAAAETPRGAVPAAAARPVAAEPAPGEFDLAIAGAERDGDWERLQELNVRKLAAERVRRDRTT